ncbi:hypothetical protein T08_13524 [Trichinella sp. T8]|nr:hypothetical protein T08_13524 [Trichinella sp. T8]
MPIISSLKSDFVFKKNLCWREFLLALHTVYNFYFSLIVDLYLDEKELECYMNMEKDAWPSGMRNFLADRLSARGKIGYV